MDQPLISIITITFNAEAVLTPTMESVRDQSFQNIEHLLIDGASTDSTIAIARQVGGKDVRIVSEPDKGLYDAMNKGLQMAKGKYVLFLNAGDTFASSDTLALYAEAAIAKDADIIYSDTDIVDSNRNFLRHRHLNVPELLTFESFADGMLVCHQAFMVKRTIAPKYNLEYRFSADYDWTVRCIARTIPEKCVNLHCVGIYYLDDGLTEKNKRASLLERFAIMRRHYGMSTAVQKHLSFIPRAISRRIK